MQELGDGPPSGASPGQFEIARHLEGIPALATLRAQAVDTWQYLGLDSASETALEQIQSAVETLWSEHLHRALTELRLAKKFEKDPLVISAPLVMVGIVVSTIWVSWMFVPVGVHTWIGGGQSFVFHGTIVLSMCSYHEAVTTKPGGIPDDWEGDPTHLPRFVLRPGAQAKKFAEERKKNGAFRYCNKEHKFKPDRAHYCRAMSQNVLRMDHYCPFIANCVGHRNHKYFMLFLLYTVVGTNLSGANLLWALFHTSHHSAVTTFMLGQGIYLSTLFSGLLTPFFAFHVWLLSKNMTTIEYCEKRGESPSGLSFPYDQGLYLNISTIMGPEWYQWLLPIGGPATEGLFWPRVDVDGMDADDTPADPLRQWRDRIASIAVPKKGEASASSRGAAESPAPSPDSQVEDGFFTNGASASHSSRGAAESTAPSPDSHVEDGFFTNVASAMQVIGSDAYVAGVGYWRSLEKAGQQCELTCRRILASPEIATTVPRSERPVADAFTRVMEGARRVCPSGLSFR